MFSQLKKSLVQNIVLIVFNFKYKIWLGWTVACLASSLFNLLKLRKKGRNGTGVSLTPLPIYLYQLNCKFLMEFFFWLIQHKVVGGYFRLAPLKFLGPTFFVWWMKSMPLVYGGGRHVSPKFCGNQFLFYALPRFWFLTTPLLHAFKERCMRWDEWMHGLYNITHHWFIQCTDIKCFIHYPI